MSKPLDITLLCNVVDNYGDIGFVYRLSRSLLEVNKNLSLRLVVNDLHSFAFMAPGLDESKAVQCFEGIKVLDWNKSDVCRADFTEFPASVILQCFQCERPSWLEEILFKSSDWKNEQKAKTLILNVEYLTAETWAEEFHLLPSATRSAAVKKINFMPGFTAKTGGLVLDENFMKCRSDRTFALSVLPKKLSAQLQACFENSLSVLVFAYPRDFTPLIQALNLASKSMNIHVFCASPQFSAACSHSDISFDISNLEPLSQKEWDALLCLCDFLFVRGEDSFSRACLTGKPFVWSAYVQENSFHLVKVSALLDLMSCHFTEPHMQLISQAMLSYNRDNVLNESSEVSDVLSHYACIGSYEKSAPLLSQMLLQCTKLSDGFSSFAKSLVSNGNLAEKLLDFISEWKLKNYSA